MDDGTRDGTDDRSTPVRRRQLSDSDLKTGFDETLSLLSHHRRRDVLYYLREHELASVETLATEIAATELDCAPEDVTASDREPIVIDLRHHHLPKLADNRLLEFDRRSGTVRRTSLPDPLRSLLEYLYDAEYALPADGDSE